MLGRSFQPGGNATGVWIAACLVASLMSGALGSSLPTAALAASEEEVVARVVALTNVERRKAGLPPLALDPALAAAAQSYAAVLAGGRCWAHTCGPEPDLARRAVGAGYREWTRLAENLAAGVTAPEDAVAAWMASEGHRANILDGGVSEVGVGVSHGGAFGMYWTQVFGTRRGPGGAGHAAGKSEASVDPDEPDGEMGLPTASAGAVMDWETAS